MDAGPKALLVPESLVGPPGKLLVGFTLKGYERHGEYFQIAPGGRAGGTVRIRRSPRPIRLSVRVVDEVGLGIRGAELEFDYRYADGGGMRRGGGCTDASGRIVMVDGGNTWGEFAEITSGALRASLWVAAPGFRPKRLSLDSLSPGDFREIDLVLERSPRIAGRVVREETGEPFPDVEVSLDLPESEPYWDPSFSLPGCIQRLWTRRTDAEGRFEFDSLLEGTYRVDIRGRELEQSLAPGRTDLEITLGEGSTRVR